MMRQIVKCFGVGLICFVSARAQQKTYWTEGFEGITWPSSSPSADVNVTAESGVWIVNKAYRTTSSKHEGTASLIMASGGYFITPQVTGGIKRIDFFSTSSGSARTIAVAVSKDGTTFVDHGTTSSGTSAGWVAGSYTVNDSAVKAVRLIPSGGNVTIDDVTLVSMIVPVISVSSASIPDFGVVETGSSSQTADFTVSGKDLAGDIGVKAPSGFKISSDNATFTDSITLVVSNGSLTDQKVYVRFSPSSPTGLTTGKIELTSTDAAVVNVSVSAKAIAVQPSTSAAISAGSITGTAVTLSLSGGDGDARIVIVKAGNAVTWIPSDGFVVSGVNSDFTAAADYSSGNRIVLKGASNTVTVTNLSVGTEYTAVCYEYNGTASGAENYLLSTNGSATFTTAQEPGLTVDPSALSFGNVVQGLTSAEKEISVSGKYLSPASGEITLTASDGFLLSGTSGSSFSSSVTIAYTESSLAATKVYAAFTPSSKTDFNGAVSVSGGGAPAKSVTVSGKGIDSAFLSIKVYYIAPDGSDDNAGTIDAPFLSLSKATAQVKAGDTIYMRGGTYLYSSIIPLSASGTDDNWRICLLNYPGEHPVLDFKNQTYGADNRALLLTGNWWYIKGLEICNAGDNGIKVEGSHNFIERCITHHNGDTGIQLGFGHVFEDTHPGISKNDGTYCAYNYIYNCDSYYNFDSDSNGGDADGFACKMHNGVGNVFRGCRAWYNSDDGWDLFETDFAVVMDSCWTWKSGVSQGNGNGFKLGGDGTGGASWGTHVVTNGVSFGHKVNCFTNNSHKDGIRIVNCLAFSPGASGYNFFFEGGHNTGVADTFYNTVSIGKTATDSSLGYDDLPVELNNSWNSGISASVADFGDLSEDAATASRQADGSLPTGFARLVAGSDLIDKGMNVGLAYAGTAPDMGPFEFGLITMIVQMTERYHSNFAIETGSVSSGTLKISFKIENAGLTTLKIYNASGREVTTLVNCSKKAGYHSVNYSTERLSGGMYYAVLCNGNQIQAAKIAVCK